MTARGLGKMVSQNVRRRRSAFVVSCFGLSIGISALVFFVALGAGVHQMVEKVFPAHQVEVVPAEASGALSLFQGARTIEQAAVEKMRSHPSVAAIFRRQKQAFPALASGGAELFGHDLQAELLAEGMDVAAMQGETLGPEPFAEAADSHAPCSSDSDCHAPEYCPSDTRACEAPIPGVLSPFVLELYNSAVAPSHGLPKIGSFLASRFRGFTFRVIFGRSMLGAPRVAAPPKERRVMLVGLSPHAAQLALTIPLTTMQRLNREFAPEKSGGWSSLVIALKPGAQPTELAGQVRALGLAVADSGAERVGLAVTLLTLLFSLVSLAMLLLGTANIAQSFYRTVAERCHEVGVWRAVGARASDVRAIFLAEAGLIGLCGGCAGFFLAWMAGRVIDFLANHYLPAFPFKPDSFFSFGWPLLVGAILCSMAACLLGALGPALRAARFDPIEALTR